MEGLIFDIKRFAIHDGPGIRTTVFFKGCPLSCLWCHNPESQSFEIQSLFARGREKAVGQFLTPKQVIAEVLKDRVFYESSGGGVTFSGGEPYAQPEFLLECLKLARKNNLHTCVDTSLAVSWSTVQKTLPYVDQFLADVKIVDPEIARKFTGATSLSSLENLRKLSATDSEILVRFALIPGITDTRENLSAVINFLLSLEKLSPVELLAYNKLDVEKNRRLGKPHQLVSHLDAKSTTSLADVKKLFENANIKIVNS